MAVGGDGTVADLLNEQPGVPLTVLPAGTENLVARHFGLGRDPEELARTIAAGSPIRVDVGLVAGRRFLLMVGFGFDGDVVSRHHQGRVSRVGLGPSHPPDRLRLAGLAIELFLPVPADHGADGRPWSRRSFDRHHGFCLQCTRDMRWACPLFRRHATTTAGWT